MEKSVVLGESWCAWSNMAPILGLWESDHQTSKQTKIDITSMDSLQQQEKMVTITK